MERPRSAPEGQGRGERSFRYAPLSSGSRYRAKDAGSARDSPQCSREQPDRQRMPPWAVLMLPLGLTKTGVTLAFIAFGARGSPSAMAKVEAFARRPFVVSFAVRSRGPTSRYCGFSRAPRRELRFQVITRASASATFVIVSPPFS